MWVGCTHPGHAYRPANWSCQSSFVGAVLCWCAVSQAQQSSAAAAAAAAASDSHHHRISHQSTSIITAVGQLVRRALRRLATCTLAIATSSTSSWIAYSCRWSRSSGRLQFTVIAQHCVKSVDIDHLIHRDGLYADHRLISSISSTCLHERNYLLLGWQVNIKLYRFNIPNCVIHTHIFLIEIPQKCNVVS